MALGVVGAVVLCSGCQDPADEAAAETYVPAAAVATTADLVTTGAADPAGGGVADDVAVDQFGVVTPDDADSVTQVPDALAEDPNQPAVAPETARGGDDVVLNVVDDGDRAASPVIEVDQPFVSVGFTWPAGSADSPALQARARALDGSWSDWFELEASDAEPDAGTHESGAEVRSGTDPLWVGESDAVQIATVGDAADAVPVDDVRLVTVAVPETSTVSVDDVAWSQPGYVSRSTWGARAPTCTLDTATSIQAAVVHHTAGPNSYSTKAQAMAQLRADQAYHMDARGWCDIGYNFVVDKWGNVYEGRAGSANGAVIGVHASGFNTSTVGISVLGCYGGCSSNATLPAAAVKAVARVAGWRLGAYGVDPDSTITFNNGSSVKTMPAIIGHRDVASTTCPGDNAYAQLAAIRSAAATYVPPVTGVVYRAHVADHGWLGWQRQGSAGTTGQSRQVEAVQVKTSGLPAGIGIQCQAHSASIGWRSWVGSGSTCGTTGKGLRLEALRLRLTGSGSGSYDVWYRVHVADIGWMGWTRNGGEAGTEGLSLRIEAVQVTVTAAGAEAPGGTGSASNRSINYRSHAAGLGWLGQQGDGTLSGTTGQSRRLEAVKIWLPYAQKWSGSVQCSAHTARIGWMPYVGAGKTCGTTGQSRQLEAVKIRLTGELAKHMDVWYRVHSANVGWSAWVKNGAVAGTQGKSLRAEAIEVVYLAKGADAP